ncbi:hypothetical protein [Streptomyces sp. NPDC018031]|uniref:hypothetical protein n=1 Tax=Streptomyces sp. NPDC018031 TaxID=3365033 RepID=UPI00379FF023
MGNGRAASDALVAFWRRLFSGPLPDAVFAMFLAVGVPDPPADPTPAQVLAFAELAGLVADRSLTRRLRARAGRAAVVDEGALLAGVGEAFAMARPALLAGERPGPGPALDRFVEAHASVRASRDTAAFRRALSARSGREPLTHVAVDHDPRIRRYWELVGAVTGDPATLGALHDWLLEALDRSVGGGLGRPAGPGPEVPVAVRPQHQDR